MSEESKDKIRERVKGYRSDEIKVVPAVIEEDLYERKTDLRVCAYCRVSTDNEQQTTSYEIQKNYYMEYISSQPNWKFVDIYADEGISGTSLKHRDNFKRMIADAEAGKFDLIVTKSVSRFARNVVDCIATQRKLKSLEPPVYILFETEGINTRQENAEVMLNMLSSFAQEESHMKSESMEWSIRRRFSKGNFMTPRLYGYVTSLDKPDRYTIVPEEAEAVKLIYSMFVLGYPPKLIAQIMNEGGFRSNLDAKHPKVKWTSAGIINIVTNERRCGKIIARKTYTKSYLTHQTAKNVGKRDQYILDDHHDGIVPLEMYEFAIKMRENKLAGAFYGESLTLNAIKEGALKGFVSACLRYPGFFYVDYLHASDAVLPKTKANVLEAKKGDISSINFEGYETVDPFLLISPTMPIMTLDENCISFNTTCRELLETDEIEILFNPNEWMIAVRPSCHDDLNSHPWVSIGKDGTRHNKKLKADGFLKTLHEGYGWDDKYGFQIFGSRKSRGNESILLFDLNYAQPFMTVAEEHNGRVSKHKIQLLNQELIEHFGTGYYENTLMGRLYLMDVRKQWNLYARSQCITEEPSWMKEARETVDAYVEEKKGEDL